MSTTKESGEQRSAEVRWANSQRVYVAGETAGVRVPLREVALNATRSMDGRVEENQSVRVYRADAPEQPTIYRRGELAEAEPAVPGWTMPVADLFVE